MTTLHEAKRMAQARGFGTIANWEKQNRKWFKRFIRGTKRQKEIAHTLEIEFLTHIRPNR